jgi:hypothetical protein
MKSSSRTHNVYCTLGDLFRGQVWKNFIRFIMLRERLSNYYVAITSVVAGISVVSVIARHVDAAAKRGKQA